MAVTAGAVAQCELLENADSFEGGFVRCMTTGDVDNDGDGCFIHSVTYTTGTPVWNIALHDVAVLDGDRILDLAVANFGSFEVDNILALLRGLGGGTFEAPQIISVGMIERSISVIGRDLDGDGVFTPAEVPVSPDVEFALPFDVDPDGDDDIALVLRRSNTVGLLVSDGAGSLMLVGAVPTGLDPKFAALTRLCGGPRHELVIANSAPGGPGSISVIEVADLPDSWRPADVNCNGFVEVDDSVAVIIGWGVWSPGVPACNADGDCTGVVWMSRTS